MRYSQRIRRGAVVGLAGTLLALTAMSLIGTASTRRAAETVARSAALAEAYGRAHDAVGDEESLERKYRLEPAPEVGARHRQAGEDLQRALSDVRARGGPADRRLADTLQTLHVEYRAAVTKMFAARDADDQATVLRIDNEETDPAFDRMDGLVEAATDEHAGKAARAVADLRRNEERIFYTMIIGFAVGLCLLGVSAAVVAGHQRALLRHADTTRRQALHDPLTGLPNRTLFADRLTQALLSARRQGTSVAVLLLDLDRFKEVNDALGHHCGDELLRQIAVRVPEVLRDSDTVARLSGDEFAVLLPDADEAEATALAERVLAGLHRSFILDDVSVDVEVGAGIAVAPVHADSAGALLRCADVALHTAKTSKTGSVLFRPEMDVQDTSRLLLLGDLRRALDATDQLVVHYQPKISLGTGELCGVEALVRWQHPTRGRLVPPADFVPIAETTGLINSLTRHVLRLAVRQAREWLEAGLRIPVAVNLSPRCLLDPTMTGHVTALLDEFGLPPGLLRLEVTETAVMANPALALSILNGLNKLGVSLSIDDFGTGYSSMAYLKRLPVDELKVDRSFVLDMTGDPEDAVLVRSAIDLGHNLGLTVVAEGVESAQHVTALRVFGCDVAQGYHYARPMPAAHLTEWLGASRVPQRSRTTAGSAGTAQVDGGVADA